MLFLYGTVINDILYFNDVISTGSYSSFGIFIFIVTHSIVASIRHSIAFSRAERVSQHLVAVDKLKDDFLIYTSNEFHGPLKGIIGIAESMIEGATGKLNTMQLSNISKIVLSARGLFNLVNDITDFLKIKNNVIVLDKKAVDIRQVTKLVFDLYKPTISRKTLGLKNNISAGTPLVYGDEGRIQQVIYTLMSNAIKNTDSGIVSINVEVIGEMLEIIITYTGKGILSDEPDRNLEPSAFERSHFWNKYRIDGMSLSIVKYLVELHGGEFRFELAQDAYGVQDTQEAKDGESSSFIFTLPLYNEKIIKQHNRESIDDSANGSTDGDINESKDRSALKKGGIAANADMKINILEDRKIEKGSEEYVKNDNFGSIKPDGKFNILVADDDPVDLQVIVNYLTLEGYNVTEVINGEEVISKIRDSREADNGKFDLLVLDIMMPKISGYEICKTLRKEYSIFELPILMVTRKGQYDDVTAGFKAGASDYISKPFDRRELLTRVGILLAFKHSVEVAIVNARNLEAEINRRTFAETLGEFSKALTSTLDLNEVLDRFLEKIKGFVSFDSGVVIIKEDNDFRVISNIGSFDRNCICNKNFENAAIVSKNLYL